MGKNERHRAILDIVHQHRIQSQEALRERLATKGFDVTQATLSRDLRELRLVKVPDAEGQQHYAPPPDAWEHTPPLRRLLHTLFVSLDGTGNLLVLKTLTGGAQPVAAALDGEEWPEVLGTIGGDDTILIIVRTEDARTEVARRINELTGTSST